MCVPLYDILAVAYDDGTSILFILSHVLLIIHLEASYLDTGLMDYQK